MFQLMSDRPFFSTRYTYPGFIFLLFFGAICRNDLMNIINTYSDTSKLIYGFIFTLSGAPIGFIISQFWYSLFFNGFFFKDGYGWVHPLKPFDTILFLEKKFNINIKNIENSIAALNYIFLLKNKIKTKNGCVETETEYDLIRNYVQRRVDILNTLGTSIISILFGLLFGLFINSKINDITILELINNNSYIIIFSIIIMILMSRGIMRITREQRKMLILLMNQINVEDVKTTLPDSYFKSKCETTIKS